ncbi:MAG: hypothetical protein KDJ65_01615 [Anaerolineae bacterium]|nr:hypothetical protein [Anaerolineae bacterium]
MTKKPTQSKTIRFAALTPFLLATIFALIQGVTNELGMSLTEKQLWELVGVFLSGCGLAAGFIRLRFLTKTGVSWNGGGEKK